MNLDNSKDNSTKTARIAENDELGGFGSNRRRMTEEAYAGLITC
jgi:hypothetical protein